MTINIMFHHYSRVPINEIKKKKKKKKKSKSPKKFQ